MQIDNKELFDKFLKEGINLFLGAGFSTMATNRDGALPVGDDLKDKLVREFGLDDFKSFKLSMISEHLKKTNKAGLITFLKTQMTVCDYNELYHNLDFIAIRNIFTLNIDDLIEKVYSSGPKTNILYDVEVYGGTENEGINFFKVNGSVTYKAEDELIFTPEELSNLHSRKSTLFAGMALKIASIPTLFWGLKIAEDSNTLSMLSSSTLKTTVPKPKWIVLTHKPDNDAMAIYYRDLGFNIIRATTEEILYYFENFKGTEKSSSTYKVQLSARGKSVVDKLFSSNFLESILKKQHPVRPLESFFSGNDPVWSDIIDQKIPILSFYDECTAKAFTGNKLLITGGIGSGKSTLLMQLSVNDTMDGIKFFFDSVTIEKARILNDILNEVSGKIYLFIDNLSSNLESFLYLSSNPRYTIICAEQDIAYDMIKHKANFQKKEIVEITELKDSDIQAICNIAKNSSFKKYDKNTSLFELAYYIWKGKSLGRKIEELINLLIENGKVELLEFYTLMTYIKSCGISASMDMLLLYYSNDCINYGHIYEYAESLQSMIDDGSDAKYEYYQLDQDYFSLRSKLFASLSLKFLPKQMLADVLIKFVSNVHKDYITRYDIFKRKGYDADIAMLSFVDTDDGIRFYEKAIEMEATEYKYQQYALFLFRKNRFKEAWDKIELAVRINPYNLVIKNTHAYILFQNNINIEEDIGTVKTTLDDTLQIMEECINKDIRKTFHVITYSENSIKYYEKFKNSKYESDSRKYISNARNYVENELSIPQFLSRENLQKLKNLQTKLTKIS